MNEWQPISSAPRDGSTFMAKLGFVDKQRNYKMSYLIRKTWYGKASHVPLYGWCHGRVEDVDLWEPTHWRPHK